MIVMTADLSALVTLSSTVTVYSIMSVDMICFLVSVQYSIVNLHCSRTQIMFEPVQYYLS